MSELPMHPTFGNFYKAYACEVPERGPDPRVGYDARCRPCMVAALSHLRSGYEQLSYSREVFSEATTLEQYVRRADAEFDYGLPLHLLDSRLGVV